MTLSLWHRICQMIQFGFYRASPIGIFFLIITTLASFKDVAFVVQSMGMMVVTSLTGLTIMWFVVYPTAYFAIVRKNPFRVIAKCAAATTYAFMLSSR